MKKRFIIIILYLSFKIYSLYSQILPSICEFRYNPEVFVYHSSLSCFLSDFCFNANVQNLFMDTIRGGVFFGMPFIKRFGASGFVDFLFFKERNQIVDFEIVDKDISFYMLKSGLGVSLKFFDTFSIGLLKSFVIKNFSSESIYESNIKTGISYKFDLFKEWYGLLNSDIILDDVFRNLSSSFIFSLGVFNSKERYSFSIESGKDFFKKNSPFFQFNLGFLPFIFLKIKGGLYIEKNLFMPSLGIEPRWQKKDLIFNFNANFIVHPDLGNSILLSAGVKKDSDFFTEIFTDYIGKISFIVLSDKKTKTVERIERLLLEDSLFVIAEKDLTLLIEIYEKDTSIEVVLKDVEQNKIKEFYLETSSPSLKEKNSDFLVKKIIKFCKKIFYAEVTVFSKTKGSLLIDGESVCNSPVVLKNVKTGKRTFLLKDKDNQIVEEKTVNILSGKNKIVFN